MQNAQNFMYGRLSTLNYLKARRDDASRHPFRRQQADRAIRSIVASLRDRNLMKLRARLLKAAAYHDEHAEWRLTNQILAYERKFEAIEAKEYTRWDEDS
jgi:hypothetical protein